MCRAVEAGRQILLLRKGGIYEAAGEFEVEHREFLLFPTYIHQNRAMLKTSEHASLQEHSSEPEQINIAAGAAVSDIIQLQDRRQMDALDEEHIWTPPLIDMRFNYRPKNSLYLLLVRAYRLHQPVTIVNTPAYAGCKSWVVLDQPVETGGVTAVLDDVKYEHRRAEILGRLDHAKV